MALSCGLAQNYRQFFFGRFGIGLAMIWALLRRARRAGLAPAAKAA